jgi:hypothetical protein
LGIPATRPGALRAWSVATAAAVLGWLFAVLLLVVGVRPAGWVFLGAAMTALALVALYARVRRMRTFEVFGFTCACITLEWPLLALATVVILSWAGALTWE